MELGKLFIGVDPSMHRTGIACISESGLLLGVWCVRSKGTERQAVIKQIEAMHQLFLAPESLLPQQVHSVTIEGQEIAYTSRRGKNPRSITMLANISGALVMISSLTWTEAELDLVAPAAWKGTVIKPVHQARTLRDVGLQYNRVGVGKEGYCSPIIPENTVLGAETIVGAEWKELSDAIGLAQYGRRKYLKTNRILETIRSGQAEPPAPAPANKPKARKRRKKGSTGAKTQDRVVRPEPSGQGDLREDGQTGNSGAGHASDRATDAAGRGEGPGGQGGGPEESPGPLHPTNVQREDVQSTGG